MKKSVDDWRPTGLNERPGLTKPDLDALQMLLPARLGSQEEAEFQARLGTIAAMHRMAEAWRDSPPPSTIRKRLEGIARTSEKLLAQIGLPKHHDRDADLVGAIPYLLRFALVPEAEKFGAAIGGYRDHPPMEFPISGSAATFLDHHGDSKLDDTLAGVQMLILWCEGAIQYSRKKERDAETERSRRYGDAGKQARNSGNEALNDLIARLGNLYRDTTKKRPTIARPRGGEGAPGGPFVRFVLAVCGRLQISMTPAAFEKRWRAIGPLVHATKAIQERL